MSAPTVTSTQATTVIATPISGDNRIDVLLDGPNYRWNSQQAMGSPVEVSYSFAKTPGYLTGSHANGFSEFTNSQIAATQKAFADIAAVTNLTFKEVPETDTSYGQIRLGNNAQAANSAGYAIFPNSVPGATAGDVFINNADPANLANVTPGTNAYATIVHEILHALGLKHPGNYNAGEPPQAVPGNYLAAAQDSEVNTIESYIKAPQKQERDSAGPYDLLALQYLYGTKAVHTGNDTYSLGDSAGQRLQLINDNGGVNTLDASAATTPATIDLNQGSSSSIGRLADGTPAITNVQIAFNTVIQNAVGTAGNDTITGNSANNVITGGGGNDTIDGGAGVDTAVFSGAKSAYTVASGGKGWIVTGQGGTSNLGNVERLQFVDAKVALDLNGNAGTTAKILGAVFGAASVSNAAYVGIGLNYLDGGMSYADLMAAALKAAGATSNSAIVNLLWTNLFHTAPTADQAAPYVAMLDNGSTTVGALGVMAADLSLNTNNINLVGLQQSGISYL